MADKISVKAETIAHVVKEIENINQKYEGMSKLSLIHISEPTRPY